LERITRIIPNEEEQLNRLVAVEVCDATGDDSSNAVEIIKKLKI
jgi:hypothetical protein